MEELVKSAIPTPFPANFIRANPKIIGEARRLMLSAPTKPDTYVWLHVCDRPTIPEILPARCQSVAALLQKKGKRLTFTRFSLIVFFYLALLP